MSKAEYKRLADYIKPVDVRNRDLKIHLSQGICNAKYFQNPKQVADNPETHKVVRTGQFAYNRATTRNGEKISIALREGPDCTVSSAYQVFEIVNENLLHPKYLMMWFKRPEFDRLAIYYSHGSAHEFFEWDAMCDVMLPIPSITRQREIVSEYETLTNRIRLNNQMIQHLEATAQTLYRKTFVEGIDKENLPEGWRKGKFTEIVRICGGGTPSTDEVNYWQNGAIPFYSPGDKTNSYYSLRTEKHITEDGLAHCSSKLFPQNTSFVTARGATTGGLAMAGCEMAMNQTCYALMGKEASTPFYVHQLAIETMASLKKEAVGATFEALVTKDFDNTEIVIAPKEKVMAYNEEVAIVYHHILLKQQENEKLTELQSLLLAKMGQF